jgi:hypothetical protein
MKLLKAFIESNIATYIVALWVTVTVIYIITTNI